MLDDPSLQMGTLCYSISAEQAQNPNLVKVVRAHNGNALYFSAAHTVSALRGDCSAVFRTSRHVRVSPEFLMNFGNLPYSPLETRKNLSSCACFRRA